MLVLLPQREQLRFKHLLRAPTLRVLGFERLLLSLHLLPPVLVRKPRKRLGPFFTALLGECAGSGRAIGTHLYGSYTTCGCSAFSFKLAACDTSTVAELD